MKNSSLTLDCLVVGSAVTILVVNTNDDAIMITTGNETAHNGATTHNSHVLIFFTPAKCQTTAATVERIYLISPLMKTFVEVIRCF